MYLLNNPVLDRELLLNLRRPRAFLLQFVYVAALGLVVYAAWPSAAKIDMTNPDAARRLVNLFFVGQYLVASLIAPSFAAGAITGEKERHSYEMLLASPLRPGAIVLGKLLAALCPLALMIVSSLPIIMLCLPLGGVGFLEVVALYLTLLASVTTFGMLSLAASSYFSRTSAALVVSYLVILPLALTWLLFWQLLEGDGAQFRLFFTFTFVPPVALIACSIMFHAVTSRLVYPPDLGSEGKEVIDEQRELREAVGMVIQRTEWPDRLFAPPKRDDLLPDGANPILDKELRSELFSQGTLMLRLVIQISMFLALPIMAFCLYFVPHWAPWYIAYVLLFNVLVGPVFSAGSVTSERERQTLDLLLVTILSPARILSGKLLSGLRVSSVLTFFLVWPIVMACVLTPEYYGNLPTFGGYLLLIALTCLTTSVVALAASVVFHTTATSLMATYVAIVALFMLPPAAELIAQTFFAEHAAAEWIGRATLVSPFSAAFSLPLQIGPELEVNRAARWFVWWGFLAFYALLNTLLLAGMTWLFHRRWRVSE